MKLTTTDKTKNQKEEVITTGYENAPGMEFRAEAMHPLRVKTEKLMEN
jgi:hypothetical protein